MEEIESEKIEKLDLFGIITAVLLITIVGFIDDINIRTSNANTEDKVGSWAYNPQ